LENFATLFKSAITALSEREVTLGSIQYVVKTEAIASIDRLLNQMYTGDSSKQPHRMWRCLGLLSSLKTHGWPYFDPVPMNLSELSLSIHHWPYRNAKEVRLYFVQSSSIGYHYGPDVESHCESSLSSAILLNKSGPELYKAVLANICHIIQTVYHREAFVFIQSGLNIAFSKALKTCQMSPGRSQSLKLANQRRLDWQQNSEPLTYGYFVFLCDPLIIQCV
jgi:hypothetical protein